MKKLITLFTLYVFSFLLTEGVFAQSCADYSAQAELTANKVKARLLQGGSLWWDGNDGQYLVPYTNARTPTPSSLFAGGIWMGGVDPAGNLKLAASTYGAGQGQQDFFPGPLSDIGETNTNNCINWDRFFKVYKKEVDVHFQLLEKDRTGEITYTAAMIPEGVKNWAAKGNPFFKDRYNFELPDTPQGLADFWDENTDGIYNPLDGDYPALFQEGCNLPVVPDEMVFWIFNDAGGMHTESNADPMQMEFQVTAFAFDRNDAFDYATFYKFKLINRAVEDLQNAYFGLWTDPDLGCYTDDYIGCDTTRNMWYLYNQDALDGQTGCTCPGGVQTFCEEIPMVGVDVLRSPINDFGEEIGMSSFGHYDNAAVGVPDPGTTDPQTAQEYFNFLIGRWRDGTPFPNNGYMFPSAPDCTDPGCSSMCTANLGEGDRRIVQSVGPLNFSPGTVKEIVLGVVWTPDVPLPCPSLNLLGADDDFIQTAFDNCLQFQETPDAPEIDWIAGDEILTGNLTNDKNSNNFEEGFKSIDILSPDNLPSDDRAYEFEGYKVFQIKDETVNWDDLDEPDKARLIYQTDIQNGIGEIVNWSLDANGDWISEPKVLSTNPDDGLNLTFEVTSDAFGGDFENEKIYHFLTLAYAQNNWQSFDSQTQTGQQTPYLQGKIKYFSASPTLIPPPNNFGTVAKIRRIDGVGSGSRFLDMCPEMYDEILSGNFDGTIKYEGDKAPFEIRITDPDNVSKDQFELTFIDSDLADSKLDTPIQWQLTNITTGETFTSDVLDGNKVSVADFPQYGFSIILNDGLEPGNNFSNQGDPKNGAIGFEKEYAASSPQWYRGIPDSTGVYDYLSTDGIGIDRDLDPNQALSKMGEGWFTPYGLLDFRERSIPYISPVWSELGGLGRQSIRLENLNNVDIVFTSDKSKWSRCVIVETTQPDIAAYGFTTESPAGEQPRNHFDTRGAPSVGKEDADGDGLPDPDGDGHGMGWFPGYAVDVETGERLNVFFGEASIYRCNEPFFDGFLNACSNGYFQNDNPTGSDMMWNPTSQSIIEDVPAGTEGHWQDITGGFHHIYVTNQPYDGCVELRDQLRPGINPLFKARAFGDVTWAGMPFLNEGQSLLPYADGLIPNNLTMKIRVDNPFAVEEGTGRKNGYPTYIFDMNDLVSSTKEQEIVYDPLREILLSPNPFSKKSTGELRIENLPQQSTIRIFDLSGKPVADLGQAENEVVVWSPNADLPEGIYFVEVRNEEFGRRVLKWVLTK